MSIETFSFAKSQYPNELETLLTEERGLLGINWKIVSRPETPSGPTVYVIAGTPPSLLGIFAIEKSWRDNDFAHDIKAWLRDGAKVESRRAASAIFAALAEWGVKRWGSAPVLHGFDQETKKAIEDFPNSSQV